MRDEGGMLRDEKDLLLQENHLEDSDYLLRAESTEQKLDVSLIGEWLILVERPEKGEPLVTNVVGDLDCSFIRDGYLVHEVVDDSLNRKCILREMHLEHSLQDLLIILIEREMRQETEGLRDAESFCP